MSGSFLQLVDAPLEIKDLPTEQFDHCFAVAITALNAFQSKFDEIEALIELVERRKSESCCRIARDENTGCQCGKTFHLLPSRGVAGSHRQRTSGEGRGAVCGPFSVASPSRPQAERIHRGRAALLSPAVVTPTKSGARTRGVAAGDMENCGCDFMAHSSRNPLKNA